MSRRAFLGSAAALLAAPALLETATAIRPTSRAYADTAPTLAVDIVNNSGAGTLYCVVSGTDPSNGRPAFLQSDGRTVFHPASPSSDGAPVGADIAIPVTGTTSITIPRLGGGRFSFSLDNPLTFKLNPGDPPGIVMPSAANPSDPNHDLTWGFCEFTYDASQIFANTSFVDFAALPIALDLDDGQHVGGLEPGGLNALCNGLRAQAAADGAPWDQLIVSDGSGNPLRVLSPNLSGADKFGTYFDDYVNRVWDKYTNEDLVIDTQYTWGVVRGRVSGGQLNFDGVGSFAKPSTAAIFSCSSAPFTTGNDEMGNLTARLAAGFNRSTLLDSADQPSSTPYYGEAHTNHYSRILHDVEIGGLGYAFPYDDVHPSGGVDVEGKVQSGNPNKLTITVNNPH